MYSVMIVEDELLARLALKNSIAWEKYNIDEILEAQDGLEALEKFRKSRPDIIIVDINLPFMNGIELIREIRKEDADIKIIILSCLEDFQYARAAIKENVSSYILKASMSLDEIETAIRNVTEEMKKERNTAPLHRVRYRQEELYQKKGRCFRRLLQGADDSEAEQDVFEMPVCLGVFHVTFKNEIDVNAELIGKMNFVKSIIATTIQEAFPCCVLTIPGELYAALIECGKDSREKREELIACMESARSLIEKYTTSRVRTGISDAVHEQGQIAEGFLEARRRMAYSTFLREERKDLQEEEAMKLLSQELRACEKEIAEKLEAWELLPVMESVKKWPSFSENFVEELRRHWEFLIHWSADFAERKEQKETAFAEQLVKESVLQLSHADTLSGGKEIFLIFLDHLGRTCQKTKKYSALVETAMTYTQKHLGDPITLADAAEAAHVSASYLSMVFSREYGMNYTEYLNGLRIEKAKVLLETGTEKLAEIAGKCGYNDHAYFTRIFKKREGVAPNEYRKRVREQ